VNEVTTTTATTSSTTTTTTTTPTATEPVCFIDIDVVDRDTNVSDASTLDCVQPVLSEEILTQIKQYCDEVGSIALDDRIPNITEFINVGDFYQANFALIIKTNTTKKRLCLQVSNSVLDLVNDVLNARTSAKTVVAHKNEDLDQWRLEMAKIMSRKGGDIGLNRFRSPEEVNPLFDVWIVDAEYSPILVILRKIIPVNLENWINSIMTEMWEKYHSMHSLTTILCIYF